MDVYLRCGCSAVALHHNAHDGLPVGHPSCFIHDCCEVIDRPPLLGRRARCSYYGLSYAKHRCGGCGWNNEEAFVFSPKPENADPRTCYCETGSDLNLPFFRFLGEGSDRALSICKCGFAKSAHDHVVPFFDTGKKMAIPLRNCILGPGFRPTGPKEFDEFYCGCWGWD